jgi:uncharacterized protein YutE (UPF0331/DUF86 family)
MDEVILNKFASLEKCIRRIREEYAACKGNLEVDILRQDSVVLNIERACEQTFYLGQRIIRVKKLGLPKEYRDIFKILAEHDIISKDLSENLQKMVGFRNLAIHEYTAIDIDKLKNIIEHKIDDLLIFARLILSLN